MALIENKIKDILVYMVAMERLKDTWFYRLYTFKIYANDILAAISAVGISHPIIQTMNDHKGSVTTIKSSLSGMANWLIVLTIVSLILWIFLKAVMKNEDVEKKTILAKSYFIQVKSIEGEFYAKVQSPNPIEGLNTIYDKLYTVFDRCAQEGISELTDLAFHDEKTTDIVNQRLKKIIDNQKDKWDKSDNINSRSN